MQVPPVNGLRTSTLIACRDLKGSLPKQLAGTAKRRTAEPVSDTTTAWGDPAITLRCGVLKGSASDDPYIFNDVHWALHDTGSSRTWTSTSLKVNIAVLIPDAYSSQAELLASLAAVLTKNLS